MIVGLFPGQGSLRPGMGEPWMDHPSAVVIAQVANVTGVDVPRLLTTAPLEELVRTDNAQLATFALSSTIAHAVAQSGVDLDLVVGHSLGEYSALAASDIVSLEQGALLVHQRGLAMAAAALLEKGSMLAVLGTDDDTLANVLEAFPRVVVANRNAPGQIVVAGPSTDLATLSEKARSLGLRKVIPLEVGGAFHSPLMAPAAEALSGALDSTVWARGRIDVVANVDATAHDGTAPWSTLLAEQLTAPVEFSRSIGELTGDPRFVEMGPGGILSGLVGRIRKGSTVVGIATPDDLAALEVLRG